MRIFKDHFGYSIRLTDERLKHVDDFHPELKNLFRKVKETLRSPDRVVRSRSDDSVALYYRFYKTTSVGSKYLCVVVKALAGDRFILTFYFIDTIKRGEILWIMGRK